MLKNIAKLEHTIEGKVGQFLCDNDTPIHIAKEMCFQFLKYLGQIEDQVKAAQESAKTEEVKNDKIEPIAE